MKKYIRILSFAALTSLVTINSCSDDFLTNEPPAVAPEVLLLNKAGIEYMLNGVYERMQNGNQSMFGAAMTSDWTYAGGCSDDAYKGTSAGDQSNFNLIERYEALPNNAYMSDRWTACYDGVARANVALDLLARTQVGSTPIEEGRAVQIEAEIKFLRAWFHFQANKVFKAIPYIKTQSELGSLTPETVPNTDAGWDGIEADLQFAIDNLAEAPYNNEKGRVTKFAAMAFKAQAHMYQKEYDLAKPLLDDIITSDKFDLAPEYNWNFDMTHENNIESIFELQCSTTATAWASVDGSGCNFHQKGAASCGGWGFYQPSRNLFDAYQVDDNGFPVLNPADREHLATDMGINSNADFIPTDHLLDPRVDYVIARRGIDFCGWGIHPGNDWIREQANGGPMMTKIFMHKKEEQSLNLNGTGFRNGKNFRTMRYASILLWRAECAIEDDDLELARTLVNQIRNRAKTSTPVMGLCTSTKNLTAAGTVVDWTQPAANYKVEPYEPAVYPFDNAANALKAVQEETRLEFGCQNHRFFDLRRWGIIDEVLNAYIADDIQFRSFMGGTSPAVFNAGRDEYWPIPQAQIDLQAGILIQDEAY